MGTLHHVILFVALLSVGLLSCKQTKEKRIKPNIVFIFIDDMGWKDLGYMGSGFYETPHIDQLAKKGMVFTQVYANAANCAPTRACLLSGQYSPRHGVYTVARSDRGDQEARRLIPLPNSRTVPLEHVMIAEALKPAGYRSAAIGKWNVGNSPEKQGFDVGIPGSGFQGHFNDKGEYLTDHLTEKAVTFIRENNPEKTGNPFFLYLAHYAVHTPIQAKDSLVQKYQEKQGTPYHNNSTYAAMIESVDQSVAKINGILEELGLVENTLLVFFSDNGGHGTYTSQKPLRGGKGMFYEGGIREPMFAYWPGKIKAGTVCEEPVIGIDFYPTFLELSGVEKPTDYVLDGRSLVPLLNGEKTLNREALFWHFPAYLQSYEGMKDESRDTIFRSRPVSVIRKGDWKLLQFHEEWVLDGGRENVSENNSVELYNLSADIGETTNLAAVQVDKRDELLDDLLDWQEEVKAPIPREVNPAYEAKMKGK
ncbi:sulfatase [Cyclobacterium jeungdonense]|uniref:Sulfatase n=1 Tax=Cyclobacterium jeungdonense TaxID=708087 RepID=A0ABT8C6V4_9BACT|nr:sulfatase [Cyclobacterium jeungdonense]MDN3687436.1 sulfatase [Cyclobacterium jeungdonense]